MHHLTEADGMRHLEEVQYFKQELWWSRHHSKCHTYLAGFSNR